MPDAYSTIEECKQLVKDATNKAKAKDIKAATKKLVGDGKAGTLEKNVSEITLNPTMAAVFAGCARLYGGLSVESQAKMESDAVSMYSKYERIAEKEEKAKTKAKAKLTK